MNEFEKRKQEKDAKRMKDYKDPEFQKGIVELFERVRQDDIIVPERGRNVSNRG